MTVVPETWRQGYTDEELAAFDAMVGACARAFNMPMKVMVGQNRRPRIVRARNATIRVMRDRYNLSYPILGGIFGRRDHTTIMHSYKRADPQDVHRLITILDGR